MAVTVIAELVQQEHEQLLDRVPRILRTTQSRRQDADTSNAITETICLIRRPQTISQSLQQVPEETDEVSRGASLPMHGVQRCRSQLRLLRVGEEGHRA